MVSEYEYWKALIIGLVKPRVPVIPYVPERRESPTRVLQVNSAWKGIESMLSDMIGRFHIGTERCLEFGVEHGYSTAALSSLFGSVVGIDTFTGDKHTKSSEDIYDQTVQRLAGFENIRLVRSNYQDWITHDSSQYNLIHVDIVHTYVDTFACGLWSASHSQCVILHDTESFPAVKRAAIEIARLTRKSFYNFEESCGLGILI
jgi:hypothetical protein